MAAANGTAARVVEIALAEVGYLERHLTIIWTTRRQTLGITIIRNTIETAVSVMDQFGIGATHLSPGVQ